MATLTPTTAAPTPLAVTTRDWVSFSEPSALPLMTSAAASPLCAFWRKSRPSDRSVLSAARRFSKAARITDSSSAGDSAAPTGADGWCECPTGPRPEFDSVLDTGRPPLAGRRRRQVGQRDAVGRALDLAVLARSQVAADVDG